MKDIEESQPRQHSGVTHGSTSETTMGKLWEVYGMQEIEPVVCKTNALPAVCKTKEAYLLLYRRTSRVHVI